MNYYYLVSTSYVTLSYFKNGSWLTGQMVPPNTVTNTIVYDGTSPYTPASNTKVVSSTNVYNIGDAFTG